MSVALRRTIGLGCAAALVGALVGCGSGDDAASTATSTTTTSAAEDQLDGDEQLGRSDLVEDLRSDYGAPGALAYVRSGGDEWFFATGSADLSGTEITESTRFRIGSITKAVTGALVVDAAARGRLSLDDRVTDHLPDLAIDESITVRMVLEHSSGLFNVGDEGDVLADVAALPDPSDRQVAEDLTQRYLSGERGTTVPDRLWVALASTHGLYFPPGSGHHYSNVNYQIAGMLLTAATGSSMAEVLRSRLTEPLDLERTSLAPDDGRAPDMRSYTADRTGELQDSTDELLALGNGASGGIISTAPELLAMLHSIVDGGFLPERLRDELIGPTPESSYRYGLGFATYELACGDFVGHGGAIAGMHTLALLDVGSDQGVVLAINRRVDDDAELVATAERMLCPER